MAKLHFIYSTMNAGKSAQLLQTEFNYRERGMTCLLLTAAVDDRYGQGKITSRLGLSAEATIFRATDSLTPFLEQAKSEGVACVLIDEAQFLTRHQVAELCEGIDRLHLPVMAYGLRTDFQGTLFEGSAALMALADDIREMRTICHCGKKATMVIRRDKAGHPTLTGNQIQIGGNDSYEALCRAHWVEAHHQEGVAFPLAP
jgi:thymidine kinase